MNLPYELFLALRYLRSGRNGWLLNVTTFVAIFAIAIGVAAFILAVSLANGFRTEMRDRILEGSAHINIARNDGSAIENPEELKRAIGKFEGVRTVQAVAYLPALLRSQSSSSIGAIRALEINGPEQIANLKSGLLQGSVLPLNDGSDQSGSVSCVMGSVMAKVLGVKPEDHVRAVLSDRPDQPLDLRVAGITRVGLYEYDATTLYVSRRSLERLMPYEPILIQVNAADLDKVEEISDRVRSVTGPEYQVSNWKESNRQLFAALELERRVVMIVIALIVLVASLNITATIALMVSNRRSEIAVLNTLGSSPINIMGIFLFQGAAIGAAGAVSGALLGLLGSGLANRLKIVQLPEEIYSIGFVPFHTNPAEILLSVCCAIAMSFLATLFPAWNAARIRPAEALRND
jgi:lipoprotein-releasing system permease protein